MPSGLRLGDRVAIRTRGDEQTLTWAQWRRHSYELAGGLQRLGLKRGETLAIMLSNRPEFHIVDLAAVLLGAIPFSIYETCAAGQIEYVIGDAQARIAVVERRHLEKLLQACRNLPTLEHVILVDPPAEGDLPDGVLALAEVQASGRGQHTLAAVAAASAQVSPEDLLTLIYTSGTTGPPKGVQLSHRNLMALLHALERVAKPPADSCVISWLPAAHIAERAAHHYLPIVYGLQTTCCHDPREIIFLLPDVRPQTFFAVPRIWEKLEAGIETMLASLPDQQRTDTERALAASLRRVRLEQRGQEVPEQLANEVAGGEERVFRGLREMLGLDRLQAVYVGAAPTPVEVIEFFHAIGVPLAELWGMSETCGLATVNPPGAIKIGTVGPPAPGIEISLAQDGEVLVRSETVMLGYRGDPEKTAQTIDSDGWLHTGDIGELDCDGYLRIVDRKKELIINAMGKNMSPANIEAQIKSASPLIGQAVAIGDRRPYNVALIVLDPDFAPVWASQQSPGDRSLQELSREPALRAAVQQAIDAANSRLARVEQIKRFAIVPGDWLPGGDELTPTMKLRRKPIGEKYAAEIERLYSEVPM